MAKAEYDETALKEILRIHDAAFAEFEKDGKVTNVRCEVCNSLITLTWLARTAAHMECSCGKFTGNLKGLLR